MFGHSVYQIGAALTKKVRRVKTTKREALDEWRTAYLPSVKEAYETDGLPDYPARSESWSNFTDSLCKDGQVTLRQYESWVSPPECSRPVRR